jgi:hypothetical protein
METLPPLASSDHRVACSKKWLTPNGPKWIACCAPGKGMIAGPGGTVGVHLEVLEAKGRLDVIGRQRG